MLETLERTQTWLEHAMDEGLHSAIDRLTGETVHMLIKDPGTYYNSHGKVVSEEVAARASFPVEEHKKQKRKKDLLDRAREKAEDDFRKAMAAAELEPLPAAPQQDLTPQITSQPQRDWREAIQSITR